MIPRHFYCILFIWRESLGPAHTLGKGITQEHEYQEAGSMGTILEASYNRPHADNNYNQTPFFIYITQNTQTHVSVYTTMNEQVLG